MALIGILMAAALQAGVAPADAVASPAVSTLNPPAAAQIQSGSKAEASAAAATQAPTPAQPEDATKAVGHTPGDPLEGVNRRVYAVNQHLDRYILGPIAVSYRRLIPRPIRGGIHNALKNWDEPGVVLNDLLQAHFTDARHAALRFAVNTTVGLGGAIDVAGRHGVVHHENGFGITMGRYGVGSGPYLFLPFIGPSTVRDIVGETVDIATNPLTNIRHIRSKTLEQVQSVVSVVDNRAHVDEDLAEIALTATDPYASLRSIYLQKMQSQVNGDVISLSDSPDIPGAPELPEGRKAAPVDATPHPAPQPPRN